MTLDAKDDSTPPSIYAIFHGMTDCIIVLNRQSRIIYANPAAHRMFKFQPNQLFNADIKTLMPAYIAQHHDHYVSHFGEKPSKIIGQKRQVMAKCKDGELFPIELSVSSHQIEGEQLFVGLIRDMTLKAKDQMKSEQRLHMLEMIEQMAGVGYWSYDIQSRELEWSNELYKLFGKESTDDTFKLSLKTMLQLFHPDDRGQATELIHQTIEQQSRFEFELRIIRNRNQVRFIHCKGMLEIDHNKLPISLFGMIEDVTEYRQIQNRLESHNQQLLETTEHLREQANTDNLTGLANRRALLHEAQSLLASTHHFQGGIGLLMMDVDRFKKVNDTYGHDVGDEVLKLVASKLKQITRELDLLARFGGEEFVALLPNTHYQHIEQIAERYRNSIESAEKEGVPKVTISIGSTFLTTEQLHTLQAKQQILDSLLKKADIALYQAKERGRNRVCYMEA